MRAYKFFRFDVIRDFPRERLPRFTRRINKSPFLELRVALRKPSTKGPLPPHPGAINADYGGLAPGVGRDRGFGHTELSGYRNIPAERGAHIGLIASTLRIR